jgi:uncharacterized protein
MIHVPTSGILSDTASKPTSRWRWASALLLGTTLSLAAAIVSQVVPSVLLGLPLQGATFALVGMLQATLGVGAVALGLHLVQLRFRDVGLVTVHWRSDLLIGAATAVAFALLQFAVIIPNTGGATRSDVAVNSAQIGKSIWGLYGYIALAWTSVFFEELFIRGFFFTTLRELLGDSRIAFYLSIAGTVLFFAALHGYQGWAGILDTGLYGGLTLTLLYVWRGRLAACIVAHALWNTLATLGIYLWY